MPGVKNMAEMVTKLELENAKVDVKDLGEAVNENKVITPRHGDPFKSGPMAIQEIEQNGAAAVVALNAKADEVVAQGFYKGFPTETALKASLPAVSEMRARADDTRKIWRWSRTSAEGVTPVTGTWTDTGLSDKDIAAADATIKANNAKAEAVSLASDDTKNQISEVINESDSSILTVVDEDSNIALNIARNEIDLPDLKIEETEVDDFQVIDKEGNIAFSAKQTNNDIRAIKAEVEGLSNQTQATKSVVDALDSEALSYSSSINNTYVTEVQKPVFDYNIIITYGQSLSTANEGYPALSKTPIEPENVLMFGDSVRSLDRLAANWRPVGGAALNGLKATVQQRDVDDSVIMTDAQVAALPTGSQQEGESFDVGAVNFWRMLQNDYFGVSVNANKKIVVLNCGVAGQSIEALSKGASSGFYNRISIAVNQLKAHIENIDPDATLGLVAILHAQGEYNYNGTGTRDRNAFLTLTQQLRNDIINDVAYGLLGQRKPPAFITYQTGASWSVDSTELSIGNAQLGMSDSVQGCWLATPSYHITDKGGHLDCNGYRWMGMHFGHVLHRILDRGIQWKPLKPLSVVGLDADIYVNFHVPKPPLQFKTIYESLTARDYVNKGFRITNGGVEIPITSVEIVGQCTIKISTNHKITSGMKLWYAPKTSVNGNGNLCDSDKTIAPFNYEYLENSGQYTSANIAELVNKPYPLNNFCVAFVRNIEI